MDKSILMLTHKGRMSSVKTSKLATQCVLVSAASSPPLIAMQKHNQEDYPGDVNQEPEKKLLTELDTIDLIYECGKAQLPFEQITSILSDRLSRPERIELLVQLNDTKTSQYAAYARGVAEGDAAINLALHDGASTGDSDAYKNLQAERRKNAINQSIRKNFGIGESD